jgi:hypothetical protein
MELLTVKIHIPFHDSSQLGDNTFAWYLGFAEKKLHRFIEISDGLGITQKQLKSVVDRELFVPTTIEIQDVRENFFTDIDVFGLAWMAKLERLQYDEKPPVDEAIERVDEFFEAAGMCRPVQKVFALDELCQTTGASPKLLQRIQKLGCCLPQSVSLDAVSHDVYTDRECWFIATSKGRQKVGLG